MRLLLRVKDNNKEYIMFFRQEAHFKGINGYIPPASERQLTLT